MWPSCLEVGVFTSGLPPHGPFRAEQWAAVTKHPLGSSLSRPELITFSHVEHLDRAMLLFQNKLGKLSRRLPSGTAPWEKGHRALPFANFVPERTRRGAWEAFLCERIETDLTQNRSVFRAGTFFPWP